MKEKRYVMVIKDEHVYYYKYEQGDEKALFFTLINHGKNDDCGITLIEMIHLIRKISAHIRSGVKKDFKFKLRRDK